MTVGRRSGAVRARVWRVRTALAVYDAGVEPSSGAMADPSEYVLFAPGYTFLLQSVASAWPAATWARTWRLAMVIGVSRARSSS